MNKITEVTTIPDRYKDNVYPKMEIRELNAANLGGGAYLLLEVDMLVPVSRQGHTFLVTLRLTSRVPMIMGTINQEREYIQKKRHMFEREILAEVENVQRYYIVDSNSFFDINGEPIVLELLNYSGLIYR